MRSIGVSSLLSLLVIAWPEPAVAVESGVLRLRAKGAAHFENDAHGKASKFFEGAWRMTRDPRDRFNLGLARLMARNFTGARRDLEAVSRTRFDDPAAYYALGILEKRMGQPQAALELLSKAQQRAPRDPATLYNRGVLLEALGRAEEAAKDYEALMKVGWTLGSHHFIASLYRHSRILLFRARSAEVDRKQLLEQVKREQALYQRYQAVVRSAASDEDLEVGRFFLPIVIPGQADDVAGAVKRPRLRFKDRTRKAGLKERRGAAKSGGEDEPRAARVVACDLIGSSNPELLELGNGSLRVWQRGKKARYREVSTKLGLVPGEEFIVQAAACGDYDNDGDMDLYLGAAGVGQLWRNDDGRFSAVVEPAKCAALPGVEAVLWLDLDHDGDLDLYLARRQEAKAGKPLSNRLCQNRGDGSFALWTGVPGLSEGRAASTAVIAFDHDGDNDVDVLVANEQPWTFLFSSLREGRFEEVSRRLGLADDRYRALGGQARDVDGDGRVDLLLETLQGLALLRNRPGGFEALELPEAPGRGLLADLDLSGHLDLVRYDEKGVSIFRNSLRKGAPGFAPEAAELPVSKAALSHLIAADLDSDGDEDLVGATSRGLRLWRNESKLGCRFVRLSLLGKRNNRRGVGAKVELRAGQLYRRATVQGEPLVLGFGAAGPVDTLRVTWPNGISQSIVDPAPCQTAVVEEVEGLAGSCPFLYAWDGERWSFIADVLGAAPLGIPMSRGSYLPQDSDEYVLVSGERLVPHDGKLRVALTEEMREETLYLDQVKLLALDHPADSRVVPNERYSFPPFPEHRVFAYPASSARAPHLVLDTFGNDVTERVRSIDGRMVGSFIPAPDAYRGAVEEHAYVVDPGDLGGAKVVWLMATGWVHWGGGSSGIAASQNPHVAFGPVRLDVVGVDGEWVTARQDIGFPAGKTRTMPVDLSDVFRHPTDFRLRIVTTLRLHWDQLELVVDPPPVSVQQTALAAQSAELHYLGFPSRVDDDPQLPERFLHDRLRAEAPWNQMGGLLTRYGQVLSLIRERDDRLAIFSAGDELLLDFDATALPPLASGMRRDYLIYLVGWNKDGDFNNGEAQQVEPLPFHGMGGYPPRQAYPKDAALRRYRKQWNTRQGRRLLPDLRPSAVGSGVERSRSLGPPKR